MTLNCNHKTTKETSILSSTPQRSAIGAQKGQDVNCFLKISGSTNGRTKNSVAVD